jgi:HD-GYP domain-containing protein (c-di-GMP phosphodiesterase class II)
MNRALLEFGSIVRKHQMGTEVLRWMGLVKHKHADTYRHSVRVAVLGRLMGEALNLSAQDQERLVLGCFLHDLGKIMVPTKILDAPAPLNQQEWRLMKLHPCIGAELLSHIMQIAAPELLGAVRSHHERWDGKGYPDGLKGEEIPLSARICCVADAFDSMVSDRPYQPRKTHDAALLELQQNADSQFDTAVVVRFGGIMEQIKRIYPERVGEVLGIAGNAVRS